MNPLRSVVYRFRTRMEERKAEWAVFPESWRVPQVGGCVGGGEGLWPLRVLAEHTVLPLLCIKPTGKGILLPAREAPPCIQACTMMLVSRVAGLHHAVQVLCLTFCKITKAHLKRILSDNEGAPGVCVWGGGGGQGAADHAIE
jgi:hypothetical protein